MVNFAKHALRVINCSLILPVLLTTACVARPVGNAEAQGAPALDVVVSFDALYEFALAVGGDRVNVVCIMPPGADAHDFEPKARDIAMLNTADAFIMNGLGMEPWAQNAINAAGNKNLIVCVASNGVEPIALRDDAQIGAQHDSSDQHIESYDPHIWLSLKCAKIMASNIRDTLIGADPGGAALYNANFDGFAGRLDALYDEYSAKYRSLTNRTLVAGHAVFAYLCRDFGLTQNSVEGVFEEGEPNARALAELIDFCRANNITTILAESLSSPLIAQTLAAEAGASVSVIYTMENAEGGLSYLERMERNLDVIYESLR